MDKMYIPLASQEIEHWLQSSDIALSLFTSTYQFWTTKDFTGGPNEFCRCSGSVSGKARERETSYLNWQSQQILLTQKFHI